MRRIALILVTLVVLLPLNVQAGAPLPLTVRCSAAMAERFHRPIQAPSPWKISTPSWRTTPPHGARIASTLSMHWRIWSLSVEATFSRSIAPSVRPRIPGSDALDERWEQRYDRRAPPTVVFNGTTYVIGSVPEGDSLLDDYRALANQSLDMPAGGTSVFSWTTAQSGSTTVTWDVNLPPSSAWSGHLVRLEVWVVEATANFPEGTNGQEDYPHIVRSISTVDELAGMKRSRCKGHPPFRFHRRLMATISRSTSSTTCPTHHPRGGGGARTRDGAGRTRPPTPAQGLPCSRWLPLLVAMRSIREAHEGASRSGCPHR